MSNRQKLKPRDSKIRYPRTDVTGYPGPGERNVYECGTCGGRIVVIHAAAGVTPMFLACRATEGCAGESHSLGYPPGPMIDQLGIAPSHAWTLPTNWEYARLSPQMQDHVRRGGLVLKPFGASS